MIWIVQRKYIIVFTMKRGVVKWVSISTMEQRSIFMF